MVAAGCSPDLSERSQAARKLASQLGEGAQYMLDAGVRRGDSRVTPLLRLAHAFGRMVAPLDVLKNVSTTSPILPVRQTSIGGGLEASIQR